MLRKFWIAAASTVMLASPSGGIAATMSYNLRAAVPLYCVVRHQPIGLGSAVGGGGISLGQFREYCNAPGGYQLIISYTPGTLQGTRITAGEDQVVLNGSGQAVLSRANGPRIRERAIAAIPGEGGFDTDRIDLQILPS